MKTIAFAISAIFAYAVSFGALTPATVHDDIPGNATIGEIVAASGVKPDLNTNAVKGIVNDSFRGGTQEVNRVTGSFDGISNRVGTIESKEVYWDSKQDAIDDYASTNAVRDIAASSSITNAGAVAEAKAYTDTHTPGNYATVSNRAMTAVQPTAISDMETQTHAAATYQPKGSYLTSETDPTVYPWAKATSKPTYGWEEIINTPTALPNPNAISFYSKSGTLISSYDGSESTSVIMEDADFQAWRNSKNLYLGENSHSTGEDYSVALGVGAEASGTHSVALGAGGVRATAMHALAVGNSVEARAMASTAIGYSSFANAQSSTAIGGNAYANGERSHAAGWAAIADALNSTAVGNAARVHTGSVGATAIGSGATVGPNATNAVQIGFGVNNDAGTLQFMDKKVVLYGDSISLASITNNNGVAMPGLRDISYTAPGGASWQSFPSSRVTSLSMVFGGGRFVGAGYGYLHYSDDGTNWVSITGTPGPWSNVAYGNGVFVGGQYDFRSGLLYSTNGVDWVASEKTDCEWYSVAYGGGRFVAAGSDGAWHSSDGIAWSRSSGVPMSSELIIYGNGRFLAFGYGGGVSCSYDGTSWEATVPTEHQVLSGAFGGGRFVIADEQHNILYSIDGTNWIQSIKTGGNVYGIAFGGGRFVAAEQGTGKSGSMWYSDDYGETWTKSFESTSVNPFSVCFGDGCFIAAASSSGVLYSGPVTNRSIPVVQQISANGTVLSMDSDNKVDIGGAILSAIDATDPVFSNEVLAVSLELFDTNTVAVLNDLAGTVDGIPLEGGAASIGTILLALLAAVAWLKKNKIGANDVKRVYNVNGTQYIDGDGGVYKADVELGGHWTLKQLHYTYIAKYKGRREVAGNPFFWATDDGNRYIYYTPESGKISINGNRATPDGQANLNPEHGDDFPGTFSYSNWTAVFTKQQSVFPSEPQDKIAKKSELDGKANSSDIPSLSGQTFDISVEAQFKNMCISTARALGAVVTHTTDDTSTGGQVAQAYGITPTDATTFGELQNKAGLGDSAVIGDL